MLTLFDGVVPFVYVARLGSFKAAAVQLGVTPAAVSKAIKRLEEELGVRLLHRTTRRVVLSEEGALFFARCEEAVALVRDGRAAVALGQQVAAGPLVVSVSAAMVGFVMKRMGRLLAAYPGLSLSVRVSDERVSLLESQVDVALRVGELSDSTLVMRRLYQPKWVTAASPAYLAVAGVPSRPAQLAAHRRLVFRSPRGVAVAWSFASDEVVEVGGAGVVEIDQGEALVHSAVAGLGVVQVFDFMVEEHLRHGALVEVLSEYASPGPPIYALCLPGQQHVPKVRVFLDALQALFDDARDRERG